MNPHYDPDLASITGGEARRHFDQGLKELFRISGVERGPNESQDALRVIGRSLVGGVVGVLASTMPTEVLEAHADDVGMATLWEALMRQQIAAANKAADASMGFTRVPDLVMESMLVIRRLSIAARFSDDKRDIHERSKNTAVLIPIVKKQAGAADGERIRERDERDVRVAGLMVQAETLCESIGLREAWLDDARARRPQAQAAKAAKARLRDLVRPILPKAQRAQEHATDRAERAAQAQAWIGEYVGLIPTKKWITMPEKTVVDKDGKTKTKMGVLRYLARGVIDPSEVMHSERFPDTVRGQIIKSRTVIQGALVRLAHSERRIGKEQAAQAAESAASAAANTRAARALSWALPVDQVKTDKAGNDVKIPGGNVARHVFALQNGKNAKALHRYEARLAATTKLRDRGLDVVLRTWDRQVHKIGTIPKERSIVAERKPCGEGASILWASPNLPTTSVKELGDAMLRVPANLAINEKKKTIQDARFLHIPLSIPAGVPAEEITDQRLVSTMAAVVRLGLGLDIREHDAVIFRHDDTECKHVHLYVSRVRRSDGRVHDMDEYEQWRALHLASQAFTALFLRENGVEDKRATFAPIITNSFHWLAKRADEKMPHVGKVSGFRVGYTHQDDITKYRGEVQGQWDSADAVPLFSRGEVNSTLRMLGEDGIADIQAIPSGFVKVAPRGGKKSLQNTGDDDIANETVAPRADRRGPYVECADERTSHREEAGWRRVAKETPTRPVLLFEHLHHRLIPGL